MTECAFSKWNPSGNVTILLAPAPAAVRAARASLAMDPLRLGGEQVGFASPGERRLDMAGGEFCVNATRTFGALLARRRAASGLNPAAPADDVFTVTVSGWPTPITLFTSGRLPSWNVTARLLLPSCPLEELSEGMVAVRLPGITHVLLDERSHARPKDIIEGARDILSPLGLMAEEACGAIWWSEEETGISMTPVVYVRDVDTLCPENACGSGTLALALHVLGGKAGSVSVRQPSGDCLSVRLLPSPQALVCDVSGMVELVCEGTVFLP